MSKINTILANITDEKLRREVFEVWGLGEYEPMPAKDVAQILVHSAHFSTPTVVDPNCYICRDPEFAMMGMSLCFPCEKCSAHIAADEGPYCPECDHDHSQGN